MSAVLKKFLLKIKENIIFILAFLVPAVILSCIFIGSEVYPFGDSIYLRSDCYHQYAPFYKELYRKITEGGNLTFSWNIGMGVNFSAIYSYYLASPINLLLGIIAPGGNVLLAIDFLIIVKTGLCGFSVAYYLTKKHNKKSLITILAGLFYAMSSYMVAFSWNIMWLDCLLLLPLITLGLEKLVKEKKYLLYTITLGIAIFSNYYIAIMICIYLVIYFLIQLFSSECEKNFKYFAGRIWLFAKYSLIAGGIGAVMILPALYALSYTASGEMNFPEIWSNYFSIMDMLSRSMMDVPVSIFNAHEPNLYCTVAVFMLVPMYCFSDKVNKSEKIGKIILIAILLVSFNTNIPNYIWHGFHFPNSLPARESFIYIFIIITMAYEAVIHLKDFTTRQIGACFAGAMVLFMIIEEHYVDTVDYPFQIVYVSAIFLSLYFILTLLYKNKRLHKNVVIYLLFIVAIAESTINGTQEEAFKVTGYSYYLEDNDGITAILDEIDDEDFYRVEKLDRKTKNDAAWNDYHGVSIFSSTANAGFTDFLGALGFEKSTNAYSYYGSTPFTSSLLSVRYVIGNSTESVPEDYMQLVGSDLASSRHLFKLDYTLPMGFMLPSYFEELWNMTGNNPFVIQNSFAQAATGIPDMFTQLDASNVNQTAYINVNEDSDVYIYVTTYIENIDYVAENTETEFYLSGSATGLKHRQIVHIGEVPAGTTVTVTTRDTDASTLQLYAYNLDTQVLDQVMAALSDEGLEVESYDDTRITGTITAMNSGVMYTSIIYDEGWKAYVDGEQVEITCIGGAMLGVPIEAGTHTVELKYTPEGFVLGWFITVGSIIILVCCVLYDWNKKKQLETAELDEEIDEDEDEDEETDHAADKVVKVDETDETNKTAEVSETAEDVEVEVGVDVELIKAEIDLQAENEEKIEN
ncbi:MAG: YfhO family protein [Clostridiales bacterium]|nr:YfhO family protein [Clostridiales bacterium]